MSLLMKLMIHVLWLRTRSYSCQVVLAYCTVQSPSWAANWFAASQEIPRISRNLEVHYRTHKRPQAVSILGQSNPVHIPISHLLEIRPNIIYPSNPRSPQWSLSLRLPTKTLYTPSPHPCAPYAQPISFFSILSSAKFWARSTNHLAYFLKFIAKYLYLMSLSHYGFHEIYIIKAVFKFWYLLHFGAIYINVAKVKSTRMKSVTVFLWKSSEWRTFWTLEPKWHSVLNLHICFSTWVNFGVMYLHTLLLNIHEFRENRCR